MERQINGFSLIGILISLAIMVVLMSLYMTSAQKALTGGTGTSTKGSVWGMQDQIQLQLLGQSMTIYAMTSSDEFLIPSKLSRSNDPYDDTSANFWSAMLLQNLAKPEQLVSPNDQGWAEPAQLDYNSRNWDANFSTDLTDIYNVSYAHMPLWGERLKHRWNPRAGRFPILGNRGPQDGLETTNSLTVDADGVWRGWVLFADGSIEWNEGTTTASRWQRRVVESNVSIRPVRSGEMDDYGPILTWD